jgi:signal peptidase
MEPAVNTIIVLGLLGGIYGILNLALPYIPLSAFVKTYVFQPLLWGFLALVVWRLPGYKAVSKLRERSTIIATALIIGFLQVVMYLIGGLFSSFGRSPSSFTPVGIIANVVFAGSMLIGTELSRTWLASRLGRRHPSLAVAFIATFYTLMSISLSQIIGLKLQIESVNQINSTWLPLLAENLLATLLARLAGPKASLAYRAIPAAFWWFCPVLPDLPWSLKGLIGAGVPIAGLSVVNYFHDTQTSRGKSKRKTKQEAFPTGTVFTAIFSVVLIWFAVGLFPFQPQLVGSGSMRPVLDVGDIVIVAKVTAANIRLGDIIQYKKMENQAIITILHRVIKIEEAGGAKSFITRGDANNAPDTEPVIPENVVGKVIYTVPKIGWLSVFIKGFFTG